MSQEYESDSKEPIHFCWLAKNQRNVTISLHISRGAKHSSEQADTTTLMDLREEFDYIEKLAEKLSYYIEQND